MFGIDLTTLILLTLVLWFVHWLGQLSGANNSTTALEGNIRKLFAAKQLAEEEATQCRFACEMYRSALEINHERIKVMEEEPGRQRHEHVQAFVDSLRKVPSIGLSERQFGELTKEAKNCVSSSNGTSSWD